MSQKQNTLTRTGIVALLACVCCILWGSAIPVIKTGYSLMNVDSADTASQIVFAGIRFTLAGILVLIFASVREKKIMIPDREILKYAVPVCLAQTVGQYFFFYIGVAHTSGVKGAIITGLGNFIAILLSCLVFRKERMTGRKIAGCVLGFAGVVVINLMGNSLDMGFKLTGEGFILIAQLSYGISTVLINLFSRKVSPVVLSGTQFTMGGIVLTLIGIGMGGHLGNVTVGGVALVGSACMERCLESCYFWICQSVVQCDIVRIDTWRGKAGIQYRKSGGSDPGLCRNLYCQCEGKRLEKGNIKPCKQKGLF